MKFLRFILVVVVSGLIILGLRKITQKPTTQQPSILAPLRERLTSHTNTITKPTTPKEITTPKTVTTNDITSRLSQEFIPELSYGSLSTSKYNTLLRNSSIYGNQNADYLIIQYCDYSMTFCRQAQREGTLIAYQDALQGNLGYVLKPVLLAGNEASELQHHALICAQQTGDESQVNRMHALLFQNSLVNDIRKIGNELGIQGFESCLIEENSRTALVDERRFATETFTLSQLPTYVLIDTRTLDWTVIPGLYEEDLVTAYLKQLTK